MARGKASTGKCIFCQKEFSKAALTRHLNTHLAEKKTGGKPGQSFLIKFETNPRWGSRPFFLHLWANGNTTLGKIDTFLRQIWLNCCGHMSAFSYPPQKQSSPMNFIKALAIGKIHLGSMDMGGEISMNKKTKDIFRKDLKLKYEYDFGSTTELQLTVLEEFQIAAEQPLMLLSRNERPEWPCQMCGEKPATQLCTVCEGENFFCESCSKKHAKTCPDFADYASMKVVNSPRMGVCAYSRGSIDLKRD